MSGVALPKHWAKFIEDLCEENASAKETNFTPNLNNDIVQYYFNIISNEFVQSMVKFEFFIKQSINVQQIYEINEIVYHLSNTTTDMFILICINEHQYNFLQYYLENEMQSKLCYISKDKFIKILHDLQKLLQDKNNVIVINNYCNTLKMKKAIVKNVNYIHRNFMSSK
jgi:hypothetical protein